MGNCLKDNLKPNELQYDDSGRIPDASSSLKGTDLPGSAPLSKNRAKEIDKYMKHNEQEELQIMKLLLLGGGSSGKSTLFRQIECIHGEEDEKDAEMEDIDRFFMNIDTMRLTIRSNAVTGLIKLLQQSDTLTKPPHNLAKCKVDFEDAQIESAIQSLLAFAKAPNDFTNKVQVTALGETMKFLWSLDAIQYTFKQRHFFSLIENLDYFLDNIVIVMDETEENRYSPSIGDILNARARTTGIVERTYWIKNVQFNIFDVGGQRSERRKWIQLFDTVNGLIFVAALNHYCCVLFEDEKVNAMQESLQLFEEICNAKWFSTTYTQFILFLNKNDLFIQRMKIDQIPLTICFPEYDGLRYSDGNNHAFEVCYEQAIVFIKETYLSQNRNPRVNKIFTHVTTATEKSNIENVFEDVRNGIVQQTLADSGFA
eukprot:653641_1